MYIPSQAAAGTAIAVDPESASAVPHTTVVNDGSEATSTTRVTIPVWHDGSTVTLNVSASMAALHA